MIPIGRIGVVGAGTMGHGIAQVAAQSGYEVMLVDAVPEALERGAAQIGKGLERLVDKGKLAAEERDRALGRLATGGRPRRASRAVDLVVEAVVERLEVKQERARRARPRLPAGRPSSPPTPARSRSPGSPRPRGAPAQVIGMHFMNPVPVMQLVEVIRGLATSAGDLRRRRGGGAADGQDAGRGARRARLRLQPRADADDQRGDLLPATRASGRPRPSTGYEARDEPSRWDRWRWPT